MNNLRLIDILVEVRRRRKMSWPTDSGTSSQQVARSGPLELELTIITGPAKVLRSLTFLDRPPHSRFPPTLFYPLVTRTYAEADWIDIKFRVGQMSYCHQRSTKQVHTVTDHTASEKF